MSLFCLYVCFVILIFGSISLVLRLIVLIVSYIGRYT